tara:strand:- start:167 stop:628 length:462 start_codon:yes stop_codon:yes gene_type:complete
MHFKKFIFIIFLLTISCTNNKVVKNHGFSALEVKANKIEILKTNKNNIKEIFGKPSSVSLFDKNTWFFIQREKVNQTIFKLGNQKLQKNNVLEIKFNDYGIVVSKKLYKLEDMKNLQIAKEKTENSNLKKSGINSLLQSLYQKINSPKINRRN